MNNPVLKNSIKVLAQRLSWQAKPLAENSVKFNHNFNQFKYPDHNSDKVDL